MATQQNKSWQERFREQFVKQPVDWRENHGWTVPYVDSHAEKLEKFFESELTTLAQKMIEAMPEKFDSKELEYDENTYNHGFNNAIIDTRQAQMEVLKELGIKI